MSLMGLGRVKTKSDLVVMRAEDKFLRFFALRVTVEPKIPGAVIPRRVFTQPGSISDMLSRSSEVRSYPNIRHCWIYLGRRLSANTGSRRICSVYETDSAS